MRLLFGDNQSSIKHQIDQTKVYHSLSKNGVIDLSYIEDMVDILTKSLSRVRFE